MMGSGLSEAELSFIQDLRRKGVLDNIDEHRLPLQDGVISCYCSDCDRSPDIYEHQCTIMRTQCSHTRIHALADNGGPLLIPRGSRAIRRGSTRDVDYIHSISFAMRMKRIKTIGLTSHIPCGIAAEHSIELSDVIALTLCAKTRIKQELASFEPKVACFLHVDYGDRMKTYFISKNKFHELYSQRRIPSFMYP